MTVDEIRNLSHLCARVCEKNPRIRIKTYYSYKRAEFIATIYFGDSEMRLTSYNYDVMARSIMQAASSVTLMGDTVPHT